MLRKRSLLALMGAITLSIVACRSQAPTDVLLPDYWPTEGWRTDAPANRDLDESELAAITDIARSEVPFLDSVLIIRNGYIAHESYYNGYDATTVHDIASVTKSWTSALVGMAQAQGKLPNLDEQLAALLPDYFSEGRYADKREITLRHLLMMRSGIDYDEDALDTGGYGTGEELLGSDLTAFGLGFPMVHEPGEAWNYSTLDTQLISAIFQHAMGQSLESFAASNLFDPLGIKEFEWLADATGTTIGGQQLSITPRDMAKLGLLYLHNGNWDSAQLVPAEWVKLSLTPQGDEAYYDPTGQTEKIEWYGYHWWTWKPDWFFGYRSFQAKGYGGQQILVFPDLDMIIVTTADLEGLTPTAAEKQEEAVGELITDTIFPALTDVELEQR